MKQYDYVRYDEDSTANQNHLREKVEELTEEIETILQPGRAKSLAMTKLEECYMWIGKAIRDDQIKRDESKKTIDPDEIPF